MPALSAAIRERVRAAGFADVGITRITPSDHADFYRAWLAAGRHGEMAYLARPDAVAKRLDPTAYWPALRSAIVLAQDYRPDGDDAAAHASQAIIARYARGRDYHRVLRARVLRLLRWIEQQVGHILPAARACVDTSPVLERELARRAGLGWFGRNTMILHPRRGSYFFLAVLLLELELDYDPPFNADHCGSCHACLDACPTDALLGRDENGAPVLDARRCISYLTIELRGPIPRELRPLIGNRIFGCDICQDVCPFNRKFSPPTSEPSFAARGPGAPPAGVEPRLSDKWHPGTDSPSLLALMDLDNAGWDAYSRGSAIRRAGRSGFLRNVAVALGNWGSPAAVPALARALAREDPLVRQHAAWALGAIASADARQALRSHAEAETHPAVLEEIRIALSAS
jgi:epoxyqueuosine reductase